MKLSEFLLKKTQALELCVIRDCGWIVASYYIDHEDLFDRYVDNGLGNMEVKGFPSLQRMRRASLKAVRVWTKWLISSNVV